MSRKYSRKYQLNEEYFNEINTEDKAYFLGFLFADGYNSEKTGSVSLELNNIDIPILEQFTQRIYSNFRPLMNHGNSTRLNISSRKISKQLASIGCMQAKSFILKFPTCIPDELLHHFIRGYMDGDGNIYTTKFQSSLELISTLNFCENISDIIRNKFGFISNISIKKTNKTNSIYRIRYFKRKQIIKILEWIYSDATIFLQRKKDYLSKMIEIENTKKYGKRKTNDVQYFQHL